MLLGLHNSPLRALNFDALHLTDSGGLAFRTLTTEARNVMVIYGALVVGIGVWGILHGKYSKELTQK